MYDIVALAASAGGLHALSQVLSGLPVEFPVPLVVVQHLNPQHSALMADILNRRTALWVKEAEHGEHLVAGRVYLAPPNYHLVVNADRTLSLTQTEFVNFVRPCADLLFESVANIYQNRAIAVVLTGKGVDGTQGVQAIKNNGGITIAQDEATSNSFGMPGSAIDTGAIDFILPLSEVSIALIKLVNCGWTMHDS